MAASPRNSQTLADRCGEGDGGRCFDLRDMVRVLRGTPDLGPFTNEVLNLRRIRLRASVRRFRPAMFLKIMSNQSAPKTAKWPFLLGDVLLLGTAAWVATVAARPLGPWQTVTIVAAVAIGGWMFIQPFLRDHEAASELEELNRLSGAAAQINKVEDAADRIGRASENWQTIQETAGQTLESLKAISDHMSKEARDFQQFIQRAGDSEKTMLKLEIEKLRRVEGEWIQVTVRMLDHVFALFTGAQRSGQAPLIEQVGNFQSACLDATRRIGLNPFAAKPGEPFDMARHRMVDGSSPEAGAPIGDTLAPGFTFQGQVIRQAIVALVVGQPEPMMPDENPSDFVEREEEFMPSPADTDLDDEPVASAPDPGEDSDPGKPASGSQSFLL
jgi:molecular chaperone GrpE (heat shock protein)